MKSLISRTLTQFFLCTIAIFILATPLFYLLTKYFYAEDMIKVIESVEQGRGIPSIDLEEDIVEGMMIQFVLVFLVISISMFITIRFITRRMWQPFDDTLEKTETFNLAQGELPHFEKTDIREFARLNDSLTQLMEKDKETFRIQKEFTENASHELQTPLAVIRSKLDLLMQEEMNERQMRLMEDLYRITTRMGHLNRNLLLLAKIENAQYTDKEDVDVTSLLDDTLPIYKVLQEHVSIRVIDDRSNPHATLRANPILLECLLKNLIVNAIRHIASQGTVEIRLRDSQLTVSNPSDSNKPLRTDTLFRRFRSNDDAPNKGNGLGLAIVKAVCDFHGWKVDYRFMDGRHCFVVSF